MHSFQKLNNQISVIELALVFDSNNIIKIKGFEIIILQLFNKISIAAQKCCRYILNF